MSTIQLSEKMPNHYKGTLEYIIKDRHGNVIDRHIEHNIIKIQAKELLSHAIANDKVWDPNAGTGNGDWVDSGIDLSDYKIKYFLLGASFDDNGAPLDSVDDRYYTYDVISGRNIPISLGPGAEYDGGLINSIPISEPDRPLKKVERYYFQSSYHPAGTPLLQDDVRALNNTIVFETTLRLDEYNGFNTTAADYFTITEIALAGGKDIDVIGTCECKPENLLLTGRNDDTAITAIANGTSTITIDAGDIAYVDVIKEGDTIKIVAENATTNNHTTLDQVTPYYLVLNKSIGGSDLTLDRAVVDSDNNAISGNVGIFKNTLRVFSARILSTPFKKSDIFQIDLRWSIIIN